jgi:hypothetical protein
MRRPNLRLLALAGAATALLAALAFHIDRLAAAEPPLQPDVDATLVSCQDGALQPLGIGVLVNNAWNHASAGDGPWRQCLQSRLRNGRTEYGWFWHWPTKDGIYAYPELLVGRTPWGSAPSNDARFPVAIGDLHALHIGYDVQSRHRGKKNLAVEFWLTDPAVPGPSADGIRAELMIWTDESSGMAGKADAPGDTVDIDGRRWIVRVQRDWGDMSGGSRHKWVFVTYRALQHTSTTRYDARRLLQHAIDQGWLEARWQIEGVEFGNEIVSGSGSTWVRRFDLTLD